MAAQLDPSSEFAALVKQLHRTPNDPRVKQAVVGRLPEMRALAKTNPLALFRLAQVYSPSSSQYKQMIMESAAKGCTNAMLSACQLLLKSETSEDMITAVHYMRIIQNSNDSYITKLSKELLDNYPRFAEEFNSRSKESAYHSNLRFFRVQDENNSVGTAEVIKGPSV